MTRIRPTDSGAPYSTLNNINQVIFLSISLFFLFFFFFFFILLSANINVLSTPSFVLSTTSLKTILFPHSEKGTLPSTRRGKLEIWDSRSVIFNRGRRLFSLLILHGSGAVEAIRTIDHFSLGNYNLGNNKQVEYEIVRIKYCLSRAFMLEAVENIE